MVFQIIGKCILATMVVNNVRKCVQEIDKLVDKLCGAGDQTGNLQKASLETGENTKLIISNSKGLVDVSGKSGI